MPKRKPHANVHKDAFADRPRGPKPKPWRTDKTPNPVVRSDSYFGRPVLGTSQIIEKLKATDQMAEIFEHNGAMVAPLMRRHALSCVDTTTMQEFLEQIQSSSPTANHELAIEGLSYRLWRKKADNNIIVRLMLNSTELTPAYEESRLVGKFALNADRHFRVSTHVRIAETPEIRLAERIISICRNELPVPDVIRLAPVAICAAPPKN